MNLFNRWFVSRKEAARLVEENQRLHALLKGEIDHGTVLTFINYAEGGPLTLGVKPPEFARRFLAELFVLALDDAKSFQTGSFEWKSGEYEMTIRRIHGKSTAQVLSELKAEIEALKNERNKSTGE